MSTQPQQEPVLAPLRLFHGTTYHCAVGAMEFGLVPRGTIGESNWKSTIESNPRTVYLTDTYAPYFAAIAVANARERMNQDTRLAIFEVDNCEELRARFVPDEDFLEQATRHDKRLPAKLKKMDMVKRTRYFRHKAREMAHFWPNSVAMLGTLGHYGPIEPKFLKRVAFIDPLRHSWFVAHAMQPTITLMNHKFCAWKYRAMIRWAFGEKVTVEEYFGADSIDFMRKEMPQQVDDAQALLADRAGVEVIQLQRAST